MTRRLALALALSLLVAVPALAQTVPVIVGGSGVDPAVEECGTDGACVRRVLEGRSRLTVEEAVRLFGVYRSMGDAAAACRLAHVVVESPIVPAPEQILARQYVSLSCR